MLKLSEGFQRKVPLLGVIAGFGLAFYLLSLALLELPLGFSYAIWSGTGTLLTVCIGVFLFKEHLGKKGIYGIALIMAGVVRMKMSSKGRGVCDTSYVLFKCCQF